MMHTMHRHSWLLALMLAGTLAACSDSDGDKGGSSSSSSSSSSGGGSDAGAATDGSGSSSGGADGSGSSSGGTSSSSGGAVCISEPVTPTGGWGKGCANATDGGYLKANSDKLPDVISDCTLKKGCTGKGDDAAVQKCIGDCIAKVTGMTADCAACYGTWAGWCGFKKCLKECATDPKGKACGDCQDCNCTVNRNACTQTP